jgi:hypothetical protein
MECRETANGIRKRSGGVYAAGVLPAMPGAAPKLWATKYEFSSYYGETAVLDVRGTVYFDRAAWSPRLVRNP